MEFDLKRNILLISGLVLVLAVGAFAIYRNQTPVVKVDDGKMGENGVPQLVLKFPEPDSAMKKLNVLLEENEDLFPLFLAAVTKQDPEFSESRKKQHPELTPKLERAIQLYRESKPVELKCDLTFPYLMDGCEGEMCGQFSKGRLKTKASVFDAAGSKNVIGEWSEGTPVFDPTDLKMKVLSEGRVRVLKDMLDADEIQAQIPRGVVFSEVGYIGEGLMLGCIGSHVFSFEGGYGNVETLANSKTEDWVNVKTDSGKSGYVLLNQVEELDGESSMGD
jgi:hypothetical protein